MEVLSHLLGLYAVVVFFNTVFSGVLWLRQRNPLYKQLFLLWLAVFISFGIQGLAGNNLFLIVMASSLIFFNVYMLASIICKLADIPMHSKLYFSVLAVALPVTLCFEYIGVGFTILALPFTIAVALPGFVAAIQALYHRWKEITFSTKGLAICTILLCLHHLDFPIFRHKPEFALLGFTIALFITFTLSIFAPASVLENVTQENSRISAEVDLAQRIQTNILPNKPVMDGYELACFMNPADEVGGDYYDVYSFGDHSWIFLGDVTGHGLGSGLVMFMVQSIVNAVLTTQANITPKQLNYLVNKILYSNLERLEDQRPMTILSMMLNRDGTCILSGIHDNFFIYRKKENKVEVKAVNHFAIGLGFTDQLEPDSFEQDALRLERDDILLLTTDGVTEAFKDGDHKGQIFGEDKLVSILKSNSEASPENIKSKILESLDSFTRGRYYDDVTFLVAKKVA